MTIEPESSKEIINKTKALIPEVYKDIAKPVLQEVGSVAGRTAKALLAPIRGMLWGWERIEELVESQIKTRLDNIPEEKRKSPEPEIAVPLLQAFSFTAQNETLRGMYINLLANSMNSDKNNIVNPSF
jgi:Abortive infection alpha